MAQALSNLLSMRRQRLRDLGRALPRPDGLLETPRQKLDLWGDRLPAGLIQLVQLRRLRVSERAGSLRPALLHRTVRGEDKRLQTLAPRLAPGLMRVVASKREALASVQSGSSNPARQYLVDSFVHSSRPPVFLNCPPVSCAQMSRLCRFF